MITPSPVRTKRIAIAAAKVIRISSAMRIPASIEPPGGRAGGASGEGEPCGAGRRPQVGVGCYRTMLQEALVLHEDELPDDLLDRVLGHGAQLVVRPILDGMWNEYRRVREPVGLRLGLDPVREGDGGHRHPRDASSFKIV